MTRPLKFRARHHVAGNWHYGFLVERNGKTFIFEQDGGQLREYQVDPKTVSQFTGLTDKNGKEIYEGDIVRNNDENWEILYDDGAWRMRELKKYHNNPLFLNEEMYSEVIGNIHENADLLKEAL